MKNFFKKLKRALKRLTQCAAPAAAAVGLLLAASSAHAQLSPITITSATNLPSIVSALSTSNSVQSYFSFPSQSGLSLTHVFNASAGTSNVYVLLYPTIDGTNYANIAWATNGSIANGTSNVTNTWNWSAAQLRGIVGFQIGISNGLNGTLTNKGITIGKPNS